jgi:hypothetical protein
VAGADYCIGAQVLNAVPYEAWHVVNGTCDYCANNFNDFASSLVTLFELYCRLPQLPAALSQPALPLWCTL